MAYRIEYLENGNLIDWELTAGTLAASQQLARMGMVERHAHLVRVVDPNSRTEIWSETVLAS